MLRVAQIKQDLESSPEDLKSFLLRRLRIKEEELLDFFLVKRSIDARNSQNIKLVYSIDVNVRDEKKLLRRLKNDRNIQITPDTNYNFFVKPPKDFSPQSQSRPVIIGAGPCGYFAALLLAQMGFQPLLIERGQMVKDRSIQTYGFWKGRKNLNSDSNVQFGEGGAGTFSDGKLYSQISDPFNYGRKVLEELVKSGANEEILIKHRPHIGTFKLAYVVKKMRSRIEKLGGEILFNRKMVELFLRETSDKNLKRKDYEVAGIKLSDGSIIKTKYLIIAIGHSARDTFRMLDRVGVLLKQKLFSVGFRIEHPQIKVDQDRWGDMRGHPELGHAEYKLVHHASNGRDVYSFCMCPGGHVVGATSENNCVVTNGMSQHTRNQRNANSAIVVNLSDEDLSFYERWKGDPLAGVLFQEALEKKAFEMGGGNFYAPVQRLEDFLACKNSLQFGAVKPSYLPGVKFADLNDSLSGPLIFAIKEALVTFSNKFSFFNDPDALLTGIEARTSSPLRIPRDENFESLNVKGLYPAGEGAGYAGGILSAGIDGIKVAESLAKIISKTSS